MEVLPCPVTVDFSNYTGEERSSPDYADDEWWSQSHGDDDEEGAEAVRALARRLEAELRAAKTAQLSRSEVLLPADLLPRVARCVLHQADSEPCGLRGCTLFINFETDQECRRIGTVKCDPSTVSTFELFLTLKQDCSSWHSILPQFLKNLARRGTIMISRDFTLTKKKLFRSYSE
ncbi:protein charybde-like isoform X1 [Schistocerca americana]|nr:protein charybde-like isoform X1 [Schistocerca americana]XP_047107858.1 protein charybde-like isoform X1 [Schistocerca piceifrons]XP_049773056.1 protein charybde-like isoform X1 [Schistocerca cancellata]XP_049803588.1 protein charybde-like isoform X1 [Schistocerca nitens]XP_049948525.1 protein charybde-like isoform X1 [Schistocerca serialis cubense]